MKKPNRDKLSLYIPMFRGDAVGHFAIVMLAILVLALTVLLTFVLVHVPSIGATITWVARIRRL